MSDPEIRQDARVLTFPLHSSTALDSYVAELGNDVSYEKSLSPSRFLKTILVRHSRGLLVVKLFIKPDPSLSLRAFRRRLTSQRDILAGVPGAFAYNTFVETEKAGYLIRQFAGSSLYDRISTRPYLTAVEKKWIAFQLLSTLRDARMQDVGHGDLKSENILILPSLSVLVTDFASAFKPTHLPLDDPTEFSFFYDSSGRRTCYLAPERFHKHAPKRSKDGLVSEEMDVFSAGCVLLEMWSDGAPFFSLSELFQFREGDSSGIEAVLRNIDDSQVRTMIASMLASHPEDRPTFEKILADYRNIVFPDYFYTFLQDFVQDLGSADQVIHALKRDWNGMIAAVFAELDVMSEEPSNDSPAPLLLNIVTSNLRNCKRASSKLDALVPLLALARRLTDEEVIDRIIPFVVTLLRDDLPQVRAGYLKALVQLLEGVRTIAVTNLGLITEYILPHVRHLADDDDLQVRCAFAETLPLIAEIGMTLLELGQVVGGNERDVEAFLPDYDLSVRELHDAVEEIAGSVLVDPSSEVRRAALVNIGRLCLVFGRSRTNDVLLSRMITYLNDRDWRLRASFLNSIVTVAAFVGPTSLEEFVLPLMEQALTDPEDFVIARVLASLSSLVDLGLLSKARMLETLSHTCGFLGHPSSWVRQGCAVLIERIATHMRPSDVCLIYPHVRPLLQCNVSRMTALELLDMTKAPLDRQALAAARDWAAERSPWWTLALQPGGSRDRKRAFNMLPAPQLPIKVTTAETTKLRALRSRGVEDIHLVALKQYVAAQASPRLADDGPESRFAGGRSISLQAQGVTPVTVFVTPKISSVLRRVTGATQPPSRRPSLAANGARQRLASQHSSDADQVFELRKKLSQIESLSAPLQSDEAVTESNEAKTSPPGSTVSTALRPKSTLTSRLSLGSEVSKAAPSIGAARAFATGQLEGVAVMRDDPMLGVLNKPQKQVTGRPPAPPRPPYTSSYEGDDPAIQRFIERNYHDGLQPISPDLGPVVARGGKVKERRRNRTEPGVIQISQIGYHHDVILGFTVSPDETFLAIAARDGSVSIWDTSRFERNITPRPRLTYQSPHKLTAICAIDTTHCLAVSDDQGNLDILRIHNGSKFSKSSRIALVKQWRVTEQGYIQHLKATQDASRVYFATTTGQLGSIDLRTGEVGRTVDHPASYGCISSICLGFDASWMVVATRQGYLTLWDVRYDIPLKTWRSNQEIACLIGQPSEESQILIGLRANSTAGTIMIGFDLFTEQITDRYNVMTHETVTFEAALHPVEKPGLADAIADPGEDVESSASVNTILQVSQAAAGRSAVQHESLLNPVSESPSTEESPALTLTAGDDRVIRAWSHPKGEESFVISGSGRDVDKRYKVAFAGTSRVWAEFPLRAKHRKREEPQLRPHLDVVTALAAFETPYSEDLIVSSGDASGVVKIWRIGRSS